jgi:hypothetical protein
MSLPTVELEMYSSTGEWRRLHVCYAADFVAALVFVAQRCRAPVDAFTVLHEKTYNIASDPRCLLKELQIE